MTGFLVVVLVASVLLISCGITEEVDFQFEGMRTEIDALKAVPTHAHERRPIENALFVSRSSIVDILRGDLDFETANERMREAVAYDPELTAAWLELEDPDIKHLQGLFESLLWAKFFEPRRSVALTRE